jgi:hypothetical protein
MVSFSVNLYGDIMSGKMVRVDESQHTWLTAFSERTGVPIAAAVRQAVAAYIQATGSKKLI